MILGSQMQEQEVGDGTNFVIILAGALLEQAENLIRMVCDQHVNCLDEAVCQISFS